jgi:protease II
MPVATPLFFRSARVLPAIAFLAATCSLHAADKLNQPVAPVRPVTEIYFGTPVVDPYRWMEDLKSPEVQTWMKGQAAYTKDYLSKLPGRDDLVKRIEALDNAATRVANVQLCGSRYFYEKTLAADQTPKLYVRGGLKGEERLLVDPQVLGGGKGRFTISNYYPSGDGKYVAVTVAPGGSELGVVHVINAATGKPLKDTIDRVWFAEVRWDPSDKFFYYLRLQKLGPGMTELDKELDPTSYLHRVGDDAVEDFAIKGHEIWLMTHKNAPRFKIMHMDLDHPDIAKADLFLAQSDLVLKSVGAAKDGIYVEGFQGGISRIMRFPDGKIAGQPLPLPFAGAVDGLYTNVQNDGVLMRLAGWTEAPQWYAYDPTTDRVLNTGLEPLDPTDFSGITSVEVAAPGVDGTPIPLSIIYKKGLKMDGQNPCLMEGYGCYGISMNPYFDAKALYAMDAYQHVKDGTAYPAVLLITGANDPRVDPVELFKMTARLQAATSSKNPILLRVDADAGHGFGSTKTQRDLITADQAALLLSSVGSAVP